MDGVLLVAMLILVVTGIAVGTTGFGFAMISVPPLLALYTPQTVVTIILGASLLPSLLVVASARQAVNLRLVAMLLPGALVGLPGGAQLLQVVDPVTLKLTAGLFVAVYALAMWRGVRPAGLGGPWAASLAGLISGALGTTTGLLGPPIIILFTARQLPRDAFRGSIAAYFVATSVIGLVILLRGGAVSAHDAAVTLLLTPAAVVGVLIGNRLARRIAPDTFQLLTVLLLLTTGTVGMATALLALR